MVKNNKSIQVRQKGPYFTSLLVSLMRRQIYIFILNLDSVLIFLQFIGIKVFH